MAAKIYFETMLVVLVLSVVLGICGTGQAQIIYVDANANGLNDGSSWTDAHNYLQDALAAAVIGDEIHVARGIYTPDRGALVKSGERIAAFQLITGVTIKGGYAGFGEPDPDARDVDLYETILSGDLDGDDGPDFANNAENSYQVVTGSGTDATAILDGFTITAGNANGAETYGYGSGMYNDKGTPTLTNCTIKNNWANSGGGGGMYDTNSAPTLTNCSFIDNWPDGMDNYNSSPTLTSCTFTGNFKAMHNQDSNPTINDCTFSDNTRGMYNVGSNPTLDNCVFSGHSGAMSNWTDSSPTLTNCTFTQNSSNSNGGGMYNEYANPMLMYCTFKGNSAENGGGMASYYSNPVLTNCTFVENTAQLQGGAMRIHQGSLTLNACTFKSNSADLGGGMSNSNCVPVLTDCSFIDNLAYEGAGMYNLNADPNLTGCTFSKNSADWSGGGMWNTNNSPVLKNCVFTGNSAGSSGGGGMENSYNNPVLNNCFFSGNSAESGGGMMNFNNNLKLANCTFNGNFANYGGGGILIAHYSKLTITNCIFWGNIADTGIDEIWDDDGVTVTISYSDVHGGWAGVGNINSDPYFVSLGYWADADDPNIVVEPNNPNAIWIDGDYHLLPHSPCVDAGDPNYVPGPNETDLDGQPRVLGGRIDMGVYEQSLPVPVDVEIYPPVINLKSQGNWITTYLTFPEGYNVADVNSGSLRLEGVIEQQWIWFDEESREIRARFPRKDVQGVLDVGVIELTVTGFFMNGTAFEGTALVRVQDGGKK